MGFWKGPSKMLSVPQKSSHLNLCVDQWLAVQGGAPCLWLLLLLSAGAISKEGWQPAGCVLAALLKVGKQSFFPWGTWAPSPAFSHAFITEITLCILGHLASFPLYMLERLTLLFCVASCGWSLSVPWSILSCDCTQYCGWASQFPVVCY